MFNSQNFVCGTSFIHEISTSFLKEEVKIPDWTLFFCVFLYLSEEQRQGKEPSKFDMGYTKPQKVNERALANYDWARTSYLPGMLEPTGQDQNLSGSIPKLICDDDSDFDDPNELGDDNIAFEHGKEEPRKMESPSMSSLFSPVDELEPQPEEPVIVEPEIFDSLAEIPRPPPDGDMVGSKGAPPSQDYVTMMGRV